MVSKQ